MVKSMKGRNVFHFLITCILSVLDVAQFPCPGVVERQLCPEWNKLAIRCQAASRRAAGECLLTKLYKLLVFTWPKNIAITLRCISGSRALLPHHSRHSILPSYSSYQDILLLSKPFAKKFSGLTLSLLFSGPILLICVCKLVLGRDFTTLYPLLMMLPSWVAPYNKH